MKRDMDLVRNILLAIESEDKSLDDIRLNLALDKLYKDDAQKPSYEIIVGHIEIMEEAELVSVKFIRSMNSHPAVSGLRMTWAGQEFLADARDEGVWANTKEKAGDASFGVVKQVLAEIVKKTLGL